MRRRRAWGVAAARRAAVHQDEQLCRHVRHDGPADTAIRIGVLESVRPSMPGSRRRRLLREPTASRMRPMQPSLA